MPPFLGDYMIIDFINRHSSFLNKLSCIALGFGLGNSSWIVFFICLFFAVFFDMLYSLTRVKCLENTK